MDIKTTYPQHVTTESGSIDYNGIIIELLEKIEANTRR